MTRSPRNFIGESLSSGRFFFFRGGVTRGFAEASHEGCGDVLS